MASKLDEIAESMPQEVDRNFETGRSLTGNLRKYADVVVNAVKHTMEHPDGSGEQSSTGSHFLDSGQSIHDDRLAFVRMCLREFDRRRALVSDVGSETLTWQLIFLVAESQMLHEQVFVSDLYVTATAAKTTTNNRINSLVASGVFEQRQHKTDARRQNIILGEHFTELLDKHIDETIRYISEVLGR
jgi:DNA-binding MarR family transcriptional regulator